MYNLYYSERQRQIAKDNQLLLHKLSTIIDKPSQTNKSIQIPNPSSNKSQRIPPLSQVRSPNKNQKSYYSVSQLRQQFKQHKLHLKISSKVNRATISKSTKDTTQYQIPSSNKIIFQQMIQLFGEFGLEKPTDKELQEPENLAQRIVLSRKSVEINEIPYLIEFSSIGGIVFVIAHNMGRGKSPVVRLRLSEREAKMLFEENDYDYEKMASKISISGLKLTIKSSIHSIAEENDVFSSEKKYYSGSKTSNKRSQNKKKIDRIRLSQYNPSKEFRKKMGSFIESGENRGEESTKVIKSTNRKVTKRYHTGENQDGEEDKKFEMAVTMKKKGETGGMMNRERKDAKMGLRMEEIKYATQEEYKEEYKEENEKQEQKQQQEQEYQQLKQQEPQPQQVQIIQDTEQNDQNTKKDPQFKLQKDESLQSHKQFKELFVQHQSDIHAQNQKVQSLLDIQQQNIQQNEQDLQNNQQPRILDQAQFSPNYQLTNQPNPI